MGSELREGCAIFYGECVGLRPLAPYLDIPEGALAAKTRSHGGLGISWEVVRNLGGQRCHGRAIRSVGGPRIS